MYDHDSKSNTYVEREYRERPTGGGGGIAFVLLGVVLLLALLAWLFFGNVEGTGNAGGDSITIDNGGTAPAGAVEDGTGAAGTNATVPSTEGGTAPAPAEETAPAEGGAAAPADEAQPAPAD